MEHDLQKQIVKLLRWNGILTLGTDVMSGLQFVNTVNQRYGFINHHKALGYTVGQADLVLLLKDGETVLVELKDGNKNNQTQEQKNFEAEARRLGHNYVVWRSFADAQNFVHGYKILLLREKVNVLDNQKNSGLEQKDVSNKHSDNAEAQTVE